MVFSDTGQKTGLIQDCEQLVFGNYGDISNLPDRLYDFTARLNRSYDKLATIIMFTDGRWQFDDTNYTDLPIGSTDLVLGQEDYTMDVEYLDVVKVLILDSGGNKSILQPFDIKDPEGEVALTRSSGTTGIPIAYDKTGNSLKLYPPSNYNKTGGLIVHYRRKPSYFQYDDTSKPVGVPAVFHRFLSLDASLDYAISKQLAIKNDLNTRLGEMKLMIEEFYSKRSQDEQKYIRAAYQNSK